MQRFSRIAISFRTLAMVAHCRLTIHHEGDNVNDRETPDQQVCHGRVTWILFLTQLYRRRPLLWWLCALSSIGCTWIQNKNNDQFKYFPDTVRPFFLSLSHLCKCKCTYISFFFHFLATFFPQKENENKVKREWILPFHYHVNLLLLRNQARIRFPLGALNAQFYAKESYCLAHIPIVTRTLDTKWRPLHLLFQCRSHFHNHIIIKSNSAFGDNGDNDGGSLKNVSLTNVRIWCRFVCARPVAPEEQPNHEIVSSLCVNFYGKSILRATTVAHNIHTHMVIGQLVLIQLLVSANFAYLLTARNIIFGNCLFVSTGFSSILHNDHNPMARRKCYQNLLQWNCIASECVVIVVGHRAQPIWKSIIITCAISSILCIGLRFRFNGDSVRFWPKTIAYNLHSKLSLASLWKRNIWKL